MIQLHTILWAFFSFSYLSVLVSQLKCLFLSTSLFNFVSVSLLFTIKSLDYFNVPCLLNITSNIKLIDQMPTFQMNVAVWELLAERFRSIPHVQNFVPGTSFHRDEGPLRHVLPGTLALFSNSVLCPF